ncbi:MAG: hypothetical protein ABIH69_01860 [bacterium]
MKRKISKKQIMENYYSDQELRDMQGASVGQTLRWLEEARRFFSKVTPKETKALQEKLAQEGW